MRILKIKTLIALLIVSSFLISSEAFGKTAFIVSISPSGIEPASMEQDKKVFLGRIAQMSKIRKYKDAKLFIDDFSSGSGLWAGTPRDLMKGGARLKGLLEAVERNPHGCSNLVAGFRKISSRIRTLRAQGYDSIIVMIWSSLIHTGMDGTCSKKINVPQLPPTQVRFDRIFHHKEITALSFLSVSKWQHTVWSEALEPTIEFFTKKGSCVFINDVAETQDLLERKFKTWLVSN